MTTDCKSSNSNFSKVCRKNLCLSGFAALGMAIAAPFAEFYALGSLIVDDDPTQTVSNISKSQPLFISAIVVYIINIIFDVILACGMYDLLNPVNNSISLFATLLKFMYTAIFATSVSKLCNIVSLIRSPTLDGVNINHEILLQLDSFKNGWNVGFIFFGMSLMLTGWLFVCKNVCGSRTKVLGVSLIIAGIGYFIDSFAQIIVPNVGINIAAFTFFGELYLMIWLLWKAYKYSPK